MLGTALGIGVTVVNKTKKVLGQPKKKFLPLVELNILVGEDKQ